MKEFLTVKEFNQLIHTVLQEAVGEVSIVGEVSGFKTSQGKWAFFDLKDTDSIVNCFMPLFRLDFPIADGQEIMVTGTPGIHASSGRFSFTVRAVTLRGEGALQKAFEDMKAKLMAEGLFDAAHKQRIPRFPEHIGIITSGEGAAVNDITKVLNGRWGGLKLSLIPVAVQGKNAPDELIAAINHFNQYVPVDVIIFGRGGGSLEDLQAFNSERVARAIFASKIPIIAGIGHEHNTSICDLVADVRAATPSNAAEICVPDRAEVKREIDMLVHRGQQGISRNITRLRHELRHQTQTLQLFISGRVSDIRALIQSLYQSFKNKRTTLDMLQQKLDMSQRHLVQRMTDRLHTAKQTYDESSKLLLALSPQSILNRGYSITYAADTQKPIVRLADIPEDGRIRTQLSDGSIESVAGAGQTKPVIAAAPPKPIKIQKTSENQSTLF